jgi:hypothetical protein
MREQFRLILDSLQDSWFQVAAFLPRALTGIVLLVVGWLIARTVQRLAVRLLRLARLEAAAEQSGVDDFLVRGGVRFTVVTLIGQILYWGLLLIFVVAAFNLTGLSMGPDFSDRLAGFLPDVMVALVVLVFGTLGARLLRGVVEAYLGNVGVTGSARIGLLVQGALMVFVVILALEQLGVDVKLLTSMFQLAFGAVCLALALAFGLGGRSWAESILQRTWPRR